MHHTHISLLRDVSISRTFSTSIIPFRPIEYIIYWFDALHMYISLISLYFTVSQILPDFILCKKNTQINTRVVSNSLLHNKTDKYCNMIPPLFVHSLSSVFLLKLLRANAA